MRNLALVLMLAFALTGESLNVLDTLERVKKRVNNALCRPGTECACGTRPGLFDAAFIRNRLAYAPDKLDPELCQASGVIGQAQALDVISSKLADAFWRGDRHSPLILLLAGAPNTGKTTVDSSLRSLLFNRARAEGIIFAHPNLKRNIWRDVNLRIRQGCQRLLISVEEVHDFPRTAIEDLLSVVAMAQSTNPWACIVVLLATNAWSESIAAMKYSSASAMLDALRANATAGSLDELLLKSATALVPFTAPTETDLHTAIDRDLQVIRCHGKRDWLFKSLVWSSEVVEFLHEQLAQQTPHPSLADVSPFIAANVGGPLTTIVQKQGEDCAEEKFVLRKERGQLAIKVL